eukprot:comp21028_c0_seq1/m.44144 comp21028_c0_seq1/g.44144  ORF comp21028_c0_seq1/g.44144 comp21028_c0_seq1/m.44144 type:complete len:368 (-) comp21028_c0_seq1:44-1147(-)
MQRAQRNPHRLNRVHKAALGRNNLRLVRRTRQILCRRINSPRIAALRNNHLAELAQRTAIVQRLADHLHTGRLRRRKPNHAQRKTALDAHELLEIRGALALHAGDRLRDLERVANHLADRRVHVRDHRHSIDPKPVARAHHALCKCLAFLDRLEKCAAANLGVEHKPLEALGGLFAHNRARDQRNRRHRARDVADRIHSLICGTHLRRLTADHAANRADNLLHLLLRERHIEPRDRLELVERAARVPKTAAADHRHMRTARRERRRQRKRHLVANTARAVLVDNPRRIWLRGPVKHAAAVQHLAGQSNCLAHRHSANEHRHQKRPGLVVGHRARRDARNQEMQLSITELAAFRLALQTLRDAHVLFL